MNKYCSSCGKVSSSHAIFCYGYGIKFLTEKSSGRERLVFGTPQLLAISGSIIALLGSIIGIVVSIYFKNIYGFTSVIASFLFTSFFGFAAFVYSIVWLIFIMKKNKGTM